MTTTRRKRPLTAGIAPPLSTLRILQSRRRSQHSSSSFASLVFQVGVFVAILFSVIYTFVSSTNLFWAAHSPKQRIRKVPLNAKKYRVHYRPETVDPPSNTKPSQIDVLQPSPNAAVPTDLAQAAVQLRQAFVEHYGPEESTARDIYQRGIWSPNLDQGTHRLTHYLQAKQQQQQTSSRPTTFHMAILGNSAPAGYGNHRHEAYASRLQDLLQPAFASINIQLQVSNWAMNDLVEFPFTWCLSPLYGAQQPAIDMMRAV